MEVTSHCLGFRLVHRALVFLRIHTFFYSFVKFLDATLR